MVETTLSEFFGGTVNASNLVSFAADDDGLDFDNGFTGTITNAVVIADKTLLTAKVVESQILMV